MVSYSVYLSRLIVLVSGLVYWLENLTRPCELFVFSFFLFTSLYFLLMWFAKQAGWKLWPFAHLITYGVIPVEQRLLWVDCVELIWVTILST